MKFKIDCNIKRIYDIEDIQFKWSSNNGAAFTVSCGDRLVRFEVEYVNLFNEFEDSTYSGIKEFKDFNLLDIVEYLIQRQNKYILDKIVLALNNNDCEILKLEAYAD